jgi:hypothetical protein
LIDRTDQDTKSDKGSMPHTTRRMIGDLPKHDKKRAKTRPNGIKGRSDMKHNTTYLNARANFPGLRASHGRVRKATKKHAAAPRRHAPNPKSLIGRHD